MIKRSWVQVLASQWEYFLLQGQLCVLTLILVLYNMFHACVMAVARILPGILPEVQVAGYS